MKFKQTEKPFYIAKTFNEAISQLHKINHGRDLGINFSLAMLDNNTELINLYRRKGQPCYGELRKYKSTHGDDCTQPNNHKPSDLHSPFPDGTPLAIAARFPQIPEQDLLEFLFSNESPWRKGFKDEKNIEWTLQDGKKIGFVLTETDIDPTVFVNLLNTIKSICFYPGMISTKFKFCELVEKGLSPKEAIMLIMTINISCLPVLGQAGSIGYYFPIHLDVKRFMDSNPRDLTGGSFQDRYDYNRTYLQNIFEFEPPSKRILKANDSLFHKIKEDIGKTPSRNLKIDGVIDSFKKCMKELLIQQQEEINVDCKKAA